MRRIFMLFGIALHLFGCGENSPATVGEGFVALRLEEAQSFDPNAVHGEIAEYKVTLTGAGLAEPLVRYFPVGTAQANFDGFPAGTSVTVSVEYVNVNGITVRRGQAGPVTIVAGTSTPVTVRINNVPIFANVRDGATIRADRFVPAIFAPGGIEFELSDRFAGEVARLTDADTGEASFSVAVDESSALRRVTIAELGSGQHELTVQDVDTGESSTISVRIVGGTQAAGLMTTSGGSTGLPLGGSFNIASYLHLFAP